QSAETIQSKFDLGIWYALGLWPALTIAVTSSWGGEDSSAKRDWFAGAISDLFVERPDTDEFDIEAVLLQVMQDEFDLNVEDESEIPVAEEIMKLRKETAEGNFAGFEAVKRRFEERGGKIPQNLQVVEHKQDGDESSEDESDDEDIDMDDAAPALVSAPREKQEPEVDEDGFTTVVSKKKR
ncbi:pre-rRNA processing protein, partial [Aureobasidium namibiae CBS 147.97]